MKPLTRSEILHRIEMWKGLESRIDFIPETGSQRPYEWRDVFPDRTVFRGSYKTLKAAEKARSKSRSKSSRERAIAYLEGLLAEQEA
jgi:hypothetical protein